MTEEKLLTGEEYLGRAYSRIISIGEAVIKTYANLEYKTNNLYIFDFDRNSMYKFETQTEFFRDFRRVSDNALARITKYSEPPQLLL